MNTEQEYTSFFNEGTKKKSIRRKQMKESYVGGDLSKLGRREIGMLAELLDLYSDNKFTKNARDYSDDVTTWGFNSNSGYVFLVTDSSDTLMENGKKLDIFILLPYGEEGFPDDFDGRSFDEFEQDDAEYLENFGKWKNGIFKSN